MFKRKISFIVLLVGALHTAAAETAGSDMSKFEIKSLKLGMSIEEGKDSIKEKCVKKLRQRTDSGMPLVNCATGSDAKDYVEFKAKDKIFTIIDGQKINVKKGESNIELKRKLLTKLVEKYGEPSVFFSGGVNLGFTNSKVYKQLVVEEAMCWGDCKKMYDTRSGKQILDFGEKAFIVTFADGTNGGRDGGGLPNFGFNGNKGKSLLVRRYLMDNHIKAESLKKMSAEKQAKQQQQAEDTKNEAEKLAEQVEL